MIYKVKKIVIMLVITLLWLGNVFTIQAISIEDFDFYCQDSLYSRNLEELNFIAQHGLGFKESQVLFDEDVDLEIYSSYAILVNLTTNEVIFEQNADTRAYPASLTKMMTVLVGLENAIGETMTINVDFDELFAEGAAIAGFRNGEVVTTKDLLYATMLPSGADAALSLAYQVAGSEEAFVELMNEKAASFGMNDTHFSNVTGLHDDDHYTTARDLAILVKIALRNSEFREIFSAKSYTTQMGTSLMFTSRMFDRMDSPLFNGGEVLGGKTGYTWEALLCLASYATDGENEYALVTMHADGGPLTPQFHVIDALTIYKYFLGT